MLLDAGGVQGQVMVHEGGQPRQHGSHHASLSQLIVLDVHEMPLGDALKKVAEDAGFILVRAERHILRGAYR
jgi:hypothetical protein